MKPLVSVIVPVYKVEEYLTRCLDSLCRQSLKEIEIVLVDDASPDRCGKICEQYAAKDTRFKVFHHTENKGLSAARNTGIRQASADYLMFADSDDWVHEDFCKDAYECAVKFKADIVFFSLQRVKFCKLFGEKYKKGKTNAKSYKSKEEAVKILLNGDDYCCNKLFHKKLFDGISFPKGYLYEDTGTTYKLVWKANSIYCLEQVLYFYCNRPGSITKTKTEKYRKDWFLMNTQRLLNLISWGYQPDNYDYHFQNIALGYCIRSEKNVFDNYYMFSEQTILNSKIIPVDFTWKKKILFLLFKHCPPLFNFICIIYGRRGN